MTNLEIENKKSKTSQHKNQISATPSKPDFAGFLKRMQQASKTADIQRFEQKERRRLRLKKIDQLKKKLFCDIPPLFQKAHIRHIPQRLSSLVFQRSPEQGLLLWGPVGSGKSYALAALARYYQCQGVRVRRVTFQELILKTRASFNNYSQSELKIFEPYKNIALLILDDIGTARNGNVESDHNRNLLEHILNHRIEHCKPTFISSNLSPENIERAYGQRIGSRLKTFMILRLNGRDRRQE